MTTWFNDTFTDADLTLATAHTSDSTGTYVSLNGNVPQIFSTAVAGKSLLGPGPGAGTYSVTRDSVIAPSADAKIPFTIYTFTVAGFIGFGLRISGTGTGTRGYVGVINTTTSKLEIWKLDSNGALAGSPLASSATITLAAATSYTGEFSVTGSLLSMSLDTTTVTFTDATITAAGYAAVIFNGTQGTGIFIDAWAPQDVAAAAATAITTSGPSPASGNVGAASSAITIGANGTITGTVVVTPSDASGGGTFSPTTASISSGTPTVAMTYTPASAGTKTLSFTNNGGLTNPSNISYTASAVGAPTAGVASFVSATASTINVSATAASGGTAPLTYQWYRSTTANTVGSLLTGATSLTLADSAALSAETPYYYTCRVTDGVASTADSNQIAGVLKAATVKLGFAGDSITYGFGLSAGQDAPTQVGIILQKTYKNRVVTITNCGVNASRTAQWVTGQAYLNTAKTAFASAGVTHVHMMFGANDASAGFLVTAATYKTNLQNIIADLTGAGYKIILSYPTFIPAGANSNATTSASVALAQSYQGQIDSLIDGVNVLRGDTLGFNYFMDNLGEYQTDMTHPTAAGAISLATLWARAIDRSLLDTSGAVTPSLTARTVTLTLGDTVGVSASLTNLKVAFYDEASPNLHTVPRYQTATGTTNSSGVLTFSVNSTLASGGTGHIVVLGAANVHYNGPCVVA